MTDKHEAHGNPFTADLVTSAKKVMGIPDEPFWAPEDLVASYRSHVLSRGSAARIAWDASVPTAAKAKLIAQHSTVDIDALSAALPVFGADANLATRQAFQKVLEATDAVLPHVIAGAADLTGNTGAKLSATSGYSSSNPSGKQVYYGIREHAMGAAMVGMALHGGVIPVGGTFFVFADYMRPSIRLAALSRARCVFVFSHDSVGVGEDGPTHQPIEHLSSLRSIPGLQVIRPADPNETAHAWLTAVTHDGPTAIILSRQNVPSVTDGTAVKPGAAIIKKVNSPVATIIGTGSEVGTALEAAAVLESEGISVNVVSLPSWDRFLALPASERNAIIPTSHPRVSVEAGSTFGWAAIASHSVGIDRFGASAPGNVVMEKLGISAANVAATVKAALSQ
jgi:transketolase